jgi:hypothetical protein
MSQQGHLDMSPVKDTQAELESNPSSVAPESAVLTSELGSANFHMTAKSIRKASPLSQ